MAPAEEYFWLQEIYNINYDLAILQMHLASDIFLMYFTFFNLYRINFIF